MAPFCSTLHLVGDGSSRRAEKARVAATSLHPGTEFRHSPDLATAATTAPAELEVLVLLDPVPDDFEAACAVLDARGLPRWAVVQTAFEDSPHSDSSDENWERPILARSIVFAASVFQLRRDHARLCGDLKTVGRRLTHDLRTPLNSISMANEAGAAVEIAGELTPALHRSIAAAVAEMGGLIDRVGTVLLASSQPIELKPIEMEEIVWNARERLDAVIRSAGATIISPEKWPAVNGIPVLLELVWTNLLSNSVVHGSPAPRIELGWTRVDASIRFWVRDSGAGVAPAKQARLFHPFDRMNELNAPAGYGLSLVQRLVELHRGSTGYSADPRPGGTFYFTLPELA